MQQPAQQSRDGEVQQGQDREENQHEGGHAPGAQRRGPEEHTGDRDGQRHDPGQHQQQEKAAEQDVDGLDGHAQQQVVVPGLEELVLGQDHVSDDHDAEAHHRSQAEIQPTQLQHLEGLGDRLEDPGEEGAQGADGQEHQRGKADEFALALGLFGTARPGEDAEQGLHPGAKQNLKHGLPPVPGTRPPGTRCP